MATAWGYEPRVYAVVLGSLAIGVGLGLKVAPADARAARRLRAAFGEFDATPITEQLRRNEPATLGRGNYTQGIETRYQGLAQGESTAEASEWEPWREGTRTHARFVKIAHETVGAGGAAPVNPAADMPGVLTLNRAAMRMDAG